MSIPSEARLHLTKFVVVILLAMVSAASARAQETRLSAVPERAAILRTALKANQWKEIEPGLSGLRVATDGIRFSAVRVDEKYFNLSLAIQDNEDGELASQYGERVDAIVVLNGGFFGEKEPGKKLFPVGLLRVKGRDFSKRWRSAGGYLILGEAKLRIAPASQVPADDLPLVLQSKPLLIEPGGNWAMNTNRAISRPRSVVCVLPDGNIMLAAFGGYGLSLYEAGWIMRGVNEGGFFGCDSAIAMDGGGSTQFWVRDHAELSIAGESPVHNAVIVRRR